MTTTPVPGADLSQLRLGTAPDSWGVWFADDPHQVALAAVPRRGRAGRLPLDRARPLRLPAHRPGAAAGRARPRAGSQLCRRHGLRRAAPRRGGLRRRPRRTADGGRGCSRALGASHLVLLPEQYTRHARRQAPRSRRELDAGAVERPRHRHDRLGKVLAGGVRRRAGRSTRTPTRHVDTQARVERFLHDTDPGRRQPVPRHRSHLLLRRRQHRDHPARSPSGSVTCTSSRWTPRSCAGVPRSSSRSAEAVKLGAMCEPPAGVPDDAAAARRRSARSTSTSSPSSSRTCTPASRDVPAADRHAHPRATSTAAGSARAPTSMTSTLTDGPAPRRRHDRRKAS